MHSNVIYCAPAALHCLLIKCSDLLAQGGWGLCVIYAFLMGAPWRWSLHFHCHWPTIRTSQTRDYFKFIANVMCHCQCACHLPLPRHCHPQCPSVNDPKWLQPRKSELHGTVYMGIYRSPLADPSQIMSKNIWRRAECLFAYTNKLRIYICRCELMGLLYYI